MSDRTIILITESLGESVKRDVFTFCTLAGLIGLGWWIDSAAMQWIGGVMGLFFTLAKSAYLFGEQKEMTVEQARRKLDEIERGEK